MDFAQGRRAKNNGMKMKELNRYGIGLNFGTLLIIKLPDSQVLRIMSRSLFMAVLLLTLRSIGSFTRGALDSAVEKSDVVIDAASFKLLSVVFPDLIDEGLVKGAHKGLVVGNGFDGMLKNLDPFGQDGIDLIVKSNFKNDEGLIPNESLDFVFGLDLKSFDKVDPVLKTGGILVTQLNNGPLGLLQRQPNYKIVYLRRFQNTVVAMRKVGVKDSLANPTRELRPCAISQEARKMAFNGLEDALLEPPRRALKSKNEPRKFMFLPDLLGDSLATYPRRIFISDEQNGVEGWFHNNYPVRNQHFEMYNLELNSYGIEKTSTDKEAVANGISDWLRNNVRQEDFVVMKAEAQVVEEMMKQNAICLIDELFLECKNEWQDQRSKRAYWQCLALYGSLRDQGVAVHQWWS